MSAFLCSDTHFNIIVSYFVDYRLDHQLWCQLKGEYFSMSKDNADQVAQCLYDENVRSVNSRYGESDKKTFVYRYLPTVKEYYSVSEIAMALDCLEYQSCEGSNYESSDAYKMITSMRKHLLKKIQDRDGANTWGIDEVKQSAREVVA